MTVASFSASRLNQLIKDISCADTIGADMLGDIAALAKQAAQELDDPCRHVLAWVIFRRMQGLQDRYDCDPMDYEASAEISSYVKSTIGDALSSLASDSVSPEDAIAFAHKVISGI